MFMKYNSMGGNIVQVFYFSYIRKIWLWLYLRYPHSALSLPEVLPGTLVDTAYVFGVAGALLILGLLLSLALLPGALDWLVPPPHLGSPELPP